MTEVVCKVPPGAGTVNVSVIFEDKTSAPNQAAVLTYTGWPWLEAYSWEDDDALQRSSNTPAARHGHALVNDGLGGLLLFGGRSATQSHNDVNRWVFAYV